MEIGIVGLPNVGKSSLFNSLTAAGVPSENFPFTTIEPNVGMVPVKDPRIDFLVDVFKAPKKVHAPIRFVDIAGLVPGASKGEGLGNKFLSHIREVDAIVQVIRCFEDENVVNVMGELNPKKDADVITTELLLADLEVVDKLVSKLHGAARSGQKDAKDIYDLLTPIQKKLQEGIPIRQQGFKPTDLKEYNFLTNKPILYLGNVGDSSDAQYKEVEAWAKQNNAPSMDINVKLEDEIMSLPEEERQPFRDELGIKDSGLNRLALEGQKLLDLITFFTAGPKEVHAWNVKRNSPIPQAAGKIHSDMEKGFIRAEIYNIEDLKLTRSEQALREKGKIRMEGKDYLTQEGDILHIHFNA